MELKIPINHQQGKKPAFNITDMHGEPAVEGDGYAR